MKHAASLKLCGSSDTLRKLANIVGEQWLFTDRAALSAYADAYTPFFNEPESQLSASAAVAPATVEEVQSIVRVANADGVPVYPISAGQNLGYGGAAPSHSGSLAIDLRRMNRIVEFDERDGTCLLEPGVTFLGLYRYVQDRNLGFVVQSPEPGVGSLVANALEHGISVARGDNFDAVCGLEVVLPNGEVMRTGMGAGSNPKLWQNHRYGYGPYVEGMFTQSNFGIVTKMGFSLLRRPEAVETFQVSSFKTGDLDRLVEIMQELRHRGLLYWNSAGSPIRSATTSANGVAKIDLPEVDALLASQGGGSSAEWDSLAKARNIPSAMVYGAVRGPAKVVASIVDHAKEAFAAVPGSSFKTVTSFRHPFDPNDVADDAKPSLGIPLNPGFHRVTRQAPNNGAYYFAPSVRASADELFKLNDVIRKVIADAGDDDFLRHWGWQGGRSFQRRSFLVIVDILIGEDVARNRRRRELFKRLVAAAAENGWGDYRAPSAFQDHVLATYSFNSHALRRFHETIKDALDPNGILSPGKNGIWPKRMRAG